MGLALACAADPPSLPPGQGTTGDRTTATSAADDGASTLDASGSTDPIPSETSSGPTATSAGETGASTGSGGDDTSTGASPPVCRGDNGLCHAAIGLLPAGDDPEPIVAGDLNGDGALDLVVGERVTASAGVLLGLGEGAFAEPVFTPLAPSTPAVSLAIADYTGDGALDVLAAQGESNAIGVLVGDGAGGLVPSGTSNGGFGLEWIVGADFDGDGTPDLAMAQRLSSSLTVALGVGDEAGTLLPLQPAFLGFGPTSLSATAALGDALGLVIASRVGDQVEVRTGDGNGLFEEVVQLASNAPVHADVADVDGDGLGDLVVVQRGNDRLAVHLATAPLVWGPASDLPIPGGARDARVVDLDLDGRLDVVIACDGEEGVAVMRGGGDGSFVQAAFFATTSNLWRLVVEDLNGDGILDVASTGQNPSGIFLVLSHAS